MGPFAAGQVVTLAFPYSDLSHSKLRPVLLLAHVGRADWIACQITGNPTADSQSITLTTADFVTGGLQRTSYLRPGKLFTANESILGEHRGTLGDASLATVRAAVIALIQSGASG